MTRKRAPRPKPATRRRVHPVERPTSAHTPQERARPTPPLTPDLQHAQAQQAALIQQNTALAQEVQDLNDRLAATLKDLSQSVIHADARPAPAKPLTHRAAAGARRAAEDELLRAIVDQAADGITVRDITGRLLFANAAAQRLAQRPVAGTTLQEAPAIWGETFDPLGTPLPVEAWPISRALRGETVRGVEWHRRLPDGTRRVVLNSAAPLKDATGTIFGAVSITTDITARKRGEEAVQNLARFPDENPHPVLRVARDGTLLYANAASALLLRGWHCQVGQRLPADWCATVADASARGMVTEAEVTCGEGRVFSCILTPIAGAEYLNIYTRDITARQQAETALQRSEAKFATAFRTSPIGITLSTVADGRYLDVNEAFLRMVGFSREELLGHTSVERGVWLSAEMRRRMFEELQATGSIRDREVTFRQKSGETFVCLFSCALVDLGGHRVALTNMLDITARKQAETALKQSEERFRKTFEGAATGIAITDWQGRFVQCNPAYAQIVGYSAEELRVVVFADLVHPEDREATLVQIHRLMAGELPYFEIENRYLHKSGIPVWVHKRVSILRDDTGAPANLLALVTDTTERKRAAEALLRLNATLEQRVQERTAELSQAVQTLEWQSGQIRSLASELTMAEQRERSHLAELIHDGLQQLLVAAKFRLDLLARGADPAIRQGCDEVVGLLNGALDDARSLTSQLSPPILRTGGLLAGLTWLVRWSRETHRLTVHLQAPIWEMPALPEDLTVLLFQSVRELLFNVVKYAQVSEASIALAQTPEGLTITVADQGVGFDPTQLRARGGVTGGFGLARTRHRLELLGGTLDIASAPGQGTRVTLAVRAPKVDRPAPPAERSEEGAPIPAAGAPASGEQRKVRVLLADDHQVVRQALAQMLRAEPDVEVVGEAGTGTAAVTLVRQLAPDVVLMDINMPELNGIEATGAIHAETPAVRVIGLSMYDSADQQAAMQQAGAVAYVSKSAPAEELLAAIRACAASEGGPR